MTQASPVPRHHTTKVPLPTARKTPTTSPRTARSGGIGATVTSLTESIPTRPATAAPLTAWIFDVSADGKCVEPRGGLKEMTVTPGQRLRITVANPPAHDYQSNDRIMLLPQTGLALDPVIDGISSCPLEFITDRHSGHWLVRNTGRANEVRVQPWGQRPFPLRPQTITTIPSEHTAIWIPVLPRGATPGDRGESFRVVVVRTAIPAPPVTTHTRKITGAEKRRFLTDEQGQSIAAFFGDFFAWPPVAAPRVRGKKELEDQTDFPGRKWENARARLVAHTRDKNGRPKGDGMLRHIPGGPQRDWYPPAGHNSWPQPEQLGNPGTYLPAVERLVELGAINLYAVDKWSRQMERPDLVPIDPRILRHRAPGTTD